MGASGIVYAFAAVSALGCPSEYIQTPLGKIPVIWALEYVPWMMIASEYESLRKGGKTFEGQKISHYGHLGGALAGAVYYFTMLHWRQKRKRQRRGFNPLLSHYIR
ncbi:putative peptidase S54, rhomboid domain, Rhomboid-like superfamily [Septoria linicola]|nr:putative peptidase S54, rhomboid domain, Rhomboid-like superfamily [Septoria linicola]